MQDVFALWRWGYLWDSRAIFLNGFLVTVKIAVGGLLLSLILGFSVGIAAFSKRKWVRAVTRIYLEIFRNIPLSLQILFIYYGAVYGGIDISPVAAGILGLGLCSGAYISEIVRAGLASVPSGQYEAAYSQGINYFHTMRVVILPQTMKVILPPLGTQLVTLILNTSVITMIAGGDLLYTTSNWASNGTLSYGPAYLVCGLLFFAVCFPITKLARRYENTLPNSR